MANNNDEINTDEITEGLFSIDLWNPFNCPIVSYIKSPMQLHFINSKNLIIGRALSHAIVDLLDNIPRKPNEHIENKTTVINTEHRLYHSRHYKFKLKDDELELDISSLAPTVFYQLREDIGISNINFRQSFSENHLEDFINPGKSGSLMYKTYNDLFILKTLRDYEAHLLMEILSDYHLELTQRSTIFNRYIGLYSLRFPTLLSSIEIYVVIMVNAFTSSLQINEIFDLKGSTINRKLIGHLSIDKLYKLKDLDFIDLYPYGIRIPSNIYHRLHMIILNDVKFLKKFNIIDYSLILGIKYLDISEDDLMLHRPTTGIAALFHMSNNIASTQVNKYNLHILPSNSQIDLTSLSISYLKPLKMIEEQIDTNLFYDNDLIAYASLPIPGIINKSNQRVYLYFAIIDMLQVYDSRKYIEQTFKKLTRPNQHLQSSVIEPDEYEKRFIKFLFDSVFIDAGHDFPWIINDVNKSVENNTNIKQQPLTRTNSNNIIEFRL